MKNHVFAVCAYGESPYLGACIRSLKSQSDPSDIILCTSTPNDNISALAERYELPLFVREGKSSISDDWNFAYLSADAKFVTIAHQDDWYERDYTKALSAAVSRYPDLTLFCTDCLLIREGKAVSSGFSGLVKRLLRLPLTLRPLADREGIKKAALRFGNPVICPSCTYNKERLGAPLFRSDFRFALDWDNLWRLAGIPGRFVCEERPLLAYRMHEGSETEKQIASEQRFAEEEAMFEKLWPEQAARFLMKFYRLAAKAYHG